VSGSAGVAGCGRVLAKVADVTIPNARPSPTPTPPRTPTPTAEPPATPVILPGGSPIGLFGDGNRPLTAAEFASLWASDPAHLAGRIVVAKGPVPTGFTCQRPLLTLGFGETAPPLGCQIGLLDNQYIAQEGYWVIRVGDDGKLSILGEISTPDTGFVYSLDQVNASTTLKNGDLVMVSGWLLEHVPTCNLDNAPLPSACGPFSELESTASDNSPAGIGVQQGAYELFTGTTGDWTVEGPPVEGVFLVRVNDSATGTLLARLQAAVP
jgi:hypothetical protein